jgi:hypothetical protein
MAINEKALTKGEVRKLTALRKSLGDEIANEAFEKWLKDKPAPTTQEDPIAIKIEKSLGRYANDKKFKLGNYGYTVKKAKGKGANGFVVVRNKKPA